MLKKTMLMVIVLALLVSTSNAGNGKDFNQSTALSICSDCAYEISSDAVGFGNVGLGYSESIHNVTFSSGADSVGTIELTFLVADPYAGAYGFDVEFTDYDTLIVDHESTAEGTWYNYQWVRNSLSVIDSTVNLLSFRVYQQFCYEQDDTLVIALDSYEPNQWHNQYVTNVGFMSPDESGLTDGYRTFLPPEVDLSVWDPDSTARYMVDAGTVGSEVAVPIHLRNLTFSDDDSAGFVVAYDTDGLVYSHFVANSTYLANAVVSDQSGELHISTSYCLGAPVPVQDIVIGTAYFDISTAASVGADYDVWVDGDSYFRACDYWTATCNTSTEKVYVEVVADSAVLKIQSRELCSTSVPGQYTLNVYLLTSQYIATGEDYTANMAFSFDTSNFTNITFNSVNNVTYGGGTMHWQVVEEGDIIKVQEHPQESSPDIAPGPAYQKIAELVFDVGSLLATDSVIIETSPSLTYANTRYTDTTLTVPDSNLRIIDGYIKVKTCSPHGCPAVYSWNGSDYVMEDYVLTHSQLQATPEPTSDYLPLKTNLEPVGDSYELQIREFEQEKTYLDQVELIAVDYPLGSKVGISEDGEIFTHEKWLEPTAAVDGDGHDVLDLIGAEDGVKYVAEGEGSVTLTFDNPYAGKGGSRLGFLAASEQKPGDPKDRDDGLTSSDNNTNWNGITAEIEDAAGTWHHLGNGPVREFETSNADWVFDDPSVSFGKEINIRISWVDGFSADVQRLLVDDGARVTTYHIAPSMAEHSALGKSVGPIASTDQNVVTLEPGQTLDLRFAALDAPANGMTRAFFLKTYGYYVSAAGGNLPTDYALNQNYPNPFNPTTTISFALPRAGDVTLTVYNLLGQQINTLVNGFMEAGTHEVVWEGTDRNGRGVASGVYFYRLTAGDYTASKKMTLLK